MAPRAVALPDLALDLAHRSRLNQPEVGLAHDEEKARQRDRVRHRCPSCESQVSAGDEACSSCGTDRPADGWVRVAELVVHGGYRPEAPPVVPPQGARPAVHRTVYLEAPGSAQGVGGDDAGHTLGLFATFMTTFVVTTALVLGIYASTDTGGASAASDQPAEGSVSVGPLPVATPAPAVPAGLSPADLAPDLLEESSDPGTSSELPVEAPAPAPTLAPPPSGPPAGQARPVPTAPRPRPLPARSKGVAAFEGLYAGTIDGRPVTFRFEFGDDGVVRATVSRRGEPLTEATGTYRLEGSSARISLDDEGAATVSSYTGTITERNVSGQITRSTGEIHYFTAKR